MRKFILPMVLLVSFILTSCKVDQTKETQLPDVDVAVDEGQLPAFDVDWANINVGTKTETIKIPKVVVVMEEEEVEIPYIDVDMPNEFGDKAERTIRVEAEVDGVEHDIEIDKVYASKNNLVVVSELEKGEQTLGDKKLRVSDQIKINAPDLNVKHYIVGEKPNRVFNDSYTYVNTTKELEEKLGDYKIIYSD